MVKPSPRGIKHTLVSTKRSFGSAALYLLEGAAESCSQSSCCSVSPPRFRPLMGKHLTFPTSPSQEPLTFLCLTRKNAKEKWQSRREAAVSLQHRAASLYFHFTGFSAVCVASTLLSPPSSSSSPLFSSFLVLVFLIPPLNQGKPCLTAD